MQTKRRIIANLLVFVAILPLSVSAALRYDSNTEIIRADETVYLLERITADGDNARVEFLDDKGQPTGGYIISNDAGKTVAIHDGAKSVCARWGRTEYFEARAVILAREYFQPAPLCILKAI